MKDETITGSTDSNGLFTAKNPIEPFGPGNLCGIDDYDRFDKSHPPLFCYNENNDLVKGVEGLEVKKGYMGLYGTIWQPIPEHAYKHFLINQTGYQMSKVMEVYIAVQPTEKADITNTEGGSERSYYADYDERFFRLHAGIDSLISTYGVQDFVFAFLKYQDKMIDSNYKLQKTWK